MKLQELSSQSSRARGDERNEEMRSLIYFDALGDIKDFQEGQRFKNCTTNLILGQFRSSQIHLTFTIVSRGLEIDRVLFCCGLHLSAAYITIIKDIV